MKKIALTLFVVLLTATGCQNKDLAGKYIDTDLILKSIDDKPKEINNKKQKVNGVKFYRVGYDGQQGCVYLVLDTAKRGSLAFYVIDKNKDQGAKSKTNQKCMAIGKGVLDKVFPDSKDAINKAMKGEKQTIKQGDGSYVIEVKDNQLGFTHTGVYSEKK